MTDRQAFIFLASTPTIGVRTLYKLQTTLQYQQLTWTEFLFGGTSQWQSCGLSAQQRDKLKQFLTRFTPPGYLEYLHAQKIHVVLPIDHNYPALLQETADPPVCLYVFGDLPVFTKPLVAVVGTRRMTEYGRYVTKKITRELCELQTTIVSGFMYGVDLTAQSTAIKLGGQTIGVLGYGHQSLSKMQYVCEWVTEYLRQGGILLSEYPPDEPPSKGTFVQRNRIIAGLSHAIVVVEAGAKSGALHTANKAVEYNRLVCAVPGSIRNPFSQGTFNLANQGAILIDSGYQVIQELSGQL